MSGPWSCQLRIYLTDEMADLARLHDRGSAALQPLTDVLSKHHATLVSQLDAFESYVAQAEREGPDGFALYQWTKATVQDAAKRAKHSGTFALHVGGDEVYPKEVADALEADLQPLVGGALVTRMSRHDTNPANNLPVPAQYRPRAGSPPGG